MPYVFTDGAEVHYEVDGSGPGLVLVHGTGGDSDKVYGQVVDRFSDAHTVVRPNFAGSGRTVDNGGELSLKVVADQVAAAATDAVDGPVDLLGFSLGALVSAAVAASHQELVSRLILVGGWTDPTGPRDRFYLETWRKLLDKDRELFKRFSTLTGFSPRAVDGFGHDGLAGSLADGWPPRGIGRQIDLCLRADIRGLLPQIAAPTLVVGLAQDQMIPVEGSRQLHAGIAGSRLLELEGEGHMDWFIQPDGLCEVVAEFLSNSVAQPDRSSS